MQFVRLATVCFVVTGAMLPVRAAPISPKNNTTLTLTSATALTAAGLGVAAVGTASVSMPGAFPVISFPITGGSTNPDGTATIQQTGSGLKLTNGPIFFATASDLIVDTLNSVVDGIVVVDGLLQAGGAEVAVFNIGPNLTLTLTPGSAAGLDAGLMTTALTPTLVIGTLATNPVVSAIPEPGSMGLLSLGALIACTLRRRRSGDLAR